MADRALLRGRCARDLPGFASAATRPAARAPRGCRTKRERRSGHDSERESASRLGLATVGLVLAASVLLALAPKAAIAACALLALGTMLAVPLALGGVLAAASALAEPAPSSRSCRWRSPRCERPVCGLWRSRLPARSRCSGASRSVAHAMTSCAASTGTPQLRRRRGCLARQPERQPSHPKHHSCQLRNQLQRVPGVASIRAFQGSSRRG